MSINVTDHAVLPVGPMFAVVRVSIADGVLPGVSSALGLVALYFDAASAVAEATRLGRIQRND